MSFAVAGTEGDEEPTGKVLRLIQVRLATLSFGKLGSACQHKIEHA